MAVSPVPDFTAEIPRQSGDRIHYADAMEFVAETLQWAEDWLHRSPEDPAPVINRINQALCAARASLPPGEWRALMDRCRKHAVCSLLHEDPLTHRSFAKPRGYQGDAELLDIIYTRDWSHGSPTPPTPRGEAIFRHTIECQAPSAVRERRELLAALIDQTAARQPGAAMLSVACGHLRELSLSHAMQEGRVASFVGLDQDEESLERVRKEWPGGTVETVAGSVLNLWRGALRNRTFDFVYSAGLYDYLDDSFAQKLTTRMFELLRPGGRLLVANYQTGVTDVGYMETFMDWSLIYRDRAAMQQLCTKLPSSEVASIHLAGDRGNAVFYLTVERKA